MAFFRFLVLSLMVFSTNFIAYSQYTLIDVDTKEAIIGANIKCGETMTVSDINGQFTVTNINCIATIEMLGYDTRSLDLSTIADGIIYLTPSVSILEATTITSSKFEQRLSEATVSVDLLKSNLINSINTSKSDEVLNKLPGVQVVGGQANIRGGSGFSYGAGSRVMVLLDDMPALQADAGFANWGDMPIEVIDQIEVVKGAASALYGSSALNGIVNFRRATPTSKGNTSIFSAYTLFLDPANEESKWWADSTMYRFNVGFNHERRVKNLDYQVHGFYSKLNSFNENTFDDRKRIGMSLKYRITEKINVGINSMVNFLSSSDFFLWKNANKGIYRPFSGTVSSGERVRFMLDPFCNIFDSKGNRHRIQTRYFYTDNQNNNNQSNQSSTYFMEYQYQRNFDKINTTITSGLLYSYTGNNAELLGDTTFSYTNAAAYIQAEKKWGKLSTVAGLRYEYNQQKSPATFLGTIIPNNGLVKDGRIISRFGLNYAFNDYSTVRASWGQGYRYPTLTERFVNTIFGSFTIFPNPALKPETGWTAEIGAKQGVKISEFKGFIDLSFFTSEYQDMIEFTFIPTPPSGFKPINVGNTRINGMEISLIGQIQIGKVPITLLSGYTYIDPIYKDYNTNESIRNSLSNPNENVLKYRSKHSWKFDAQAEYKISNYKCFLGLSYQFYSHLVNIDKAFEEPIGGLDLFEIKYYRELDNDGFKIWDARAGIEYKSLKLTFLMNNVFNEVYTVRPALLEAPRNATLRLDVKF